MKQKTVMTVTQTNTLGKEDCDNRLDKIGKILARESVIYIGGIGNLNKPRAQEEYVYTFPNHGTFHGNGHTLQYIVIANKLGDCFDAYSGSEKPCPREGFQIQ